MNNKNPFFPAHVIAWCIIFFFVFLMFKCSCSDSSSAQGQSMPDKPSKQAAYVESQEYAKNMLVSPASAEFPYMVDDEIVQWDENTFVINSYVDSQNSFGAMLRSHYQCKVVYSSDGLVSIQNFKMQ